MRRNWRKDAALTSDQQMTPTAPGETYVKIKGAWKCLYRAVDSTGQPIDFMQHNRQNCADAILPKGHCSPGRVQSILEIRRTSIRTPPVQGKVGLPDYNA